MGDLDLRSTVRQGGFEGGVRRAMKFRARRVFAHLILFSQICMFPSLLCCLLRLWAPRLRPAPASSAKRRTARIRTSIQRRNQASTPHLQRESYLSTPNCITPIRTVRKIFLSKVAASLSHLFSVVPHEGISIFRLSKFSIYLIYFIYYGSDSFHFVRAALPVADVSPQESKK